MHVGITATDFPLMKARMHVSVGDEVARGQLLFEDRKSEGVLLRRRPLESDRDQPWCKASTTNCGHRAE